MSKQCPIEFTLSLISGKWKIVLLKELSQKPLRYGEIVKLVPEVSAKVLIQKLRELEEDALVERVVYPEVPPRVEYFLSDKGRSIFAIFTALRGWGLGADDGESVQCRFCEKCRPYIAKEKENGQKP